MFLTLFSGRLLGFDVPITSSFFFWPKICLGVHEKNYLNYGFFYVIFLVMPLKGL
jgi:hypothetical protein